MKRIDVTHIFLALISAITLSCSSRVYDGQYRFEVYATNDLHGRLFDSLYVGDTIHDYSLSKVSKYIKEARERIGKESVMLFDAGDVLQGDNSVYYFNYIDTIAPHIVSEIFNYIGYDAAIVGNHDIEAGHRNYDKMIRELKMPYIAANAMRSNTEKSYFLPYTILKRAGLKFAVIGATNPNIKSWLSEELYSGIDFKELKPLMQNIVDSIRREQKPDIVILIIHAGLGNNDRYEMENPASYLANNMDGVDIIFAAHDHKKRAETYSRNGYSTSLLEGSSRAEYLSLAELSIVVKNGKVVERMVTPKLVSMKEVESDSDYTERFYPQFKKVKIFTNKIVGKIAKRVYSEKALTGPSEYVDMIHTVQLWKSGAQISFAAPLSRNVIIREGEINFQDLMNIYPYENQLFILEMSGREIKDYLEFSYANWFAGSVPFYNFDSATGIVYEVSRGGEYGKKVKIISMADGSSFDLDKKYRVAMTSYRANGGGDLMINGAGIPKQQLESRVLERFEDMREIFYNYMREYGEITPEIIGNWRITP